ncbi:MAG: ABC transporter substrate-binding protein [Deltaproteobacteria bacterium]|nr:ABC transporter substrate-binding protein [Deltaproteobacteria bacterium]
MIRRFFLALALLSFVFFLCSCKRSGSGAKPQIWVYTSMYKHVVDLFERDVAEALPDVEVKWFQSGSEKVMAKLEAEKGAGGIKADLILISDPFWYETAKRDRLLAPYPSPAAAHIPADLKDQDHFFVTARVPVMVLAYNRNLVKREEAPASFYDLLNPKWAGKIAIGSPLESGSHFTAVANLSRKYGWDFYRKLRAQNIFCSGGNSTVMTKLQSGEYAIGILLLEDILQKKLSDPQSVVEPLYPSDGVILIPSPVAIVKTTRFMSAAQRFYDYFLSARGQKIVTEGFMYSPFADITAPSGAKPFAEVLSRAFPYNQAFLSDVVDHHAAIKRQFSAIMFEN